MKLHPNDYHRLPVGRTGWLTPKNRLMSGSHFYICGDAKRMAKDVERTLITILQSQGGMDASTATAWLNAMKQSGRYACDVY